MRALERLEWLAARGYKACWYARRVNGKAVPYVRVSYPDEDGPVYHVNGKPDTREAAEALLEENMTASLGGQ